jgi:M penetrans paralogue family 26
MEEQNLSNQIPNQGQNINQQFNNQFGQQPIPNGNAVLVLGILSIVFCFCYGIIGLILGIVALALSGKAHVIYNANPDGFSKASFNNLKAGKVCAIIGTILSALTVVYVIVVLAVVGSSLSAMPWDKFTH